MRQSSGWPPRGGDEVVIDATVDTGTGPYTFRRFTGRLGRTTGSLTDGSLASEITDTLGDSLRALVNIPPMITGNYTKSYQIAYRAMEQAGLGVLPPPDSSTVAHVAGQGGNEPVVDDPSGTGAIGYGDPYGLLKITNLRIETTRTTRTEPRMLVMGRASSDEDSEVRASLSNGTTISLRHNRTTRNLGLFVSGVGWVLNTTSVDSSPLPILAFQTLVSGIRVFTSPTTWVNVDDLVGSVGRWVPLDRGEMLIGQSVRYLVEGVDGAEAAALTPKFPAAWQYSALETGYLPATRSIENVTARSVVGLVVRGHPRIRVDGRAGEDMVRGPLPTRVPRSITHHADRRASVLRLLVRWATTRSGPHDREGLPAHDQPTEGDRGSCPDLPGGSTRTFETSETVERFIEAETEVEWGPVDLTPSSRANASVSG